MEALQNSKNHATHKQFVEAAKQIIMGERIQAFNIRGIAQAAGYTPATFYKYFANLDELIGYCIDSFIDDLEKSILNVLNLTEEIEKRDRLFFVAFTRYFVQYVGIFQLLFSENVLTIKKNPEITKRLVNFPIELLKIEEGDKQKSIKLAYKGIIGQLLFYINRYEPREYKDFDNEVKSILDSFNL